MRAGEGPAGSSSPGPPSRRHASGGEGLKSRLGCDPTASSPTLTGLDNLMDALSIHNILSLELLPSFVVLPRPEKGGRGKSMSRNYADIFFVTNVPKEKKVVE